MPEVHRPHGGDTWVEGWDMAFKDTKSSDYVVGQRWVRRGAQRILTAQVRDKWSFTATLPQVRAFSAAHVKTRLIEDKRSEERRVGKECVSTCRSRWAPYH